MECVIKRKKSSAQLQRKQKLSSSDRISRLPDEVVDNILTRIPLQEAVRTSILSRRWRFMWRHISEVIIDDSFCGNLTIDEEDDLFLNIDQVLLLHTGSILKFELSLSRLESPEYVDRVIYSVLKRVIKDFNYSRACGHYEFPLSFFSCEQFEHLSLRHCVVTSPSEFKAFGKLVSLEFHGVSICGKVCSSMISGCPLLQNLTLIHLQLCGQLEIVAPNLKVFQCAGTFSSILFKSAPGLESLSMFINNYNDENAKEPVVLFDSLPALQFLELDDLSYKYIVVAMIGSARNRHVMELNNLKVLKLYGISFGYGDEASSVFSLIRSSKNLERLTIRARNVFCEGRTTSKDLPGIWEHLGMSGIYFDHLREVNIQDITGTKQELIFIEYILANASKLLSMVLKAYTSPSYELELVAMVTQFRRESCLAQITFNWPY